MSFTKRALAIAVAACCSSVAHAATSSGTDLWLQEINGHQFYHASYAVWATDGGTFDLDSATVTTPWPWTGSAPQPGDENYDLYAHQYFYVTAWAKGSAANEYDLRKEYVINWDAATPFNFNIKNVDLVTFYPNAFSDGAGMSVTNLAGAGITPAVPEPETYAMMLAGLGITAMAARRRRAKV
ncbi:PEP-CTERM sorting domain-containing protein [Niveibacterium sp. 24ML]|uniref:PEP-CTERM sorting domain-containing protein n=1 Tax=Niveibacterium sp. 24ML TaxID=2985512 RepID=UPI00226E62BD|nr:PEP-CTERM sorting domain-containing protein [Niveibacterium sp. 24ML]MCX9157130.1 PEP-CTERM sorting domain-containing protein [Niveibacterium sp. 24ML]